MNHLMDVAVARMRVRGKFVRKSSLRMAASLPQQYLLPDKRITRPSKGAR
jgi:hypothetical protein